MPKVSNETNAALRVIVAYSIEVETFAQRPKPPYVDINDGPSGPIRLSSDAADWTLQPYDTQYVECKHTNDIIFSTKLDEEMGYEIDPYNWIAGKIDPDEHIHISWVGHEHFGGGHWEVLNNEGGRSHHSFRQ